MRVRKTLIAAGIALAATAACSGDDDSATTSVVVDLTTTAPGGDSGEVTTVPGETDTTIGESAEVTTTVPPTTKPGQTTTAPAPTTTTTPPTTVVQEGGERPPGIPGDFPLPDGELIRTVESEASFAILYGVGNAEDAVVEYHQQLVEDGWSAGDVVQSGAIEDFAAGFSATKGGTTINVTAGENIAEGDDGILLSIVGL